MWQRVLRSRSRFSRWAAMKRLRSAVMVATAAMGVATVVRLDTRAMPIHEHRSRLESDLITGIRAIVITEVTTYEATMTTIHRQSIDTETTFTCRQVITITTEVPITAVTVTR